MPLIDAFAGRMAVAGSTDVPLVESPLLRCRIRRADPDGMHANPYILGLTGTSLVVSWGSFAPLVSHPVTINFISDDYNAAIAAIIATGSPDITAYDDGGFLVLQSLHAGGKNFLFVPSTGTALPLLGLEIGDNCTAGDIATSTSGGVLQGNRPGTELVARHEDLTAPVVNRAIAGSLRGLDYARYDLEREIPVFRSFSLTLGAPQTFFTGSSAPGLRLAIQALLSLGLAKGIRIQDSSGMDAYNASGDTKAFVTSVTYGTLVNSAVPFVAWGTPDGKSVVHSSVPAILKTGLLPIASIDGDIITYTAGAGLGLETLLSHAHDMLVIRGATNSLPFNHNGEYGILGFGGILDTQVQVRPLGTNEPLIVNTEDVPRALNPRLDLATVYGNLSAYVGNFVRLGMAGTSGSDHMVFNLNTTLPAGTYTITLPVGVSLRELSSLDLITGLEANDPDVAYKHQSNNFFPAQIFRNKITLGQDLVSSAADAETARQSLPIPAVATATYTLLSEAIGPSGIGARLYAYSHVSGTHFVLTSNAYWTNGPGGHWNKDPGTGGVLGENIYSTKYELAGDTFKLFTRAKVAGTWDDSSWTDTTLELNPGISANIVPSNFDGVLGLGAGLLGTFGDATLFPRLKVPRAVQGTSERTLVLELPPATGETAGSIRIYTTAANFGSIFSVFEITFNAKWLDSGGHQWAPDTLTQPAVKMDWLFGELFVSGKTAGVALWADNAWDSSWGLGQYNYSIRQDPTESFNQLTTNSIKARSVAKTWGVFSTIQNGGSTKVATGDAILATSGNVFPMNLHGLTLVLQFSGDDGGTYPVTRTHTFAAANPYANVGAVIADINADNAFIDSSTANDGFPSLTLNSSVAELLISATRGPNLRMKVAASTGIGAGLLRYTVAQTSPHSSTEGFSFQTPSILGMNIFVSLLTTTTTEYVVIITDEGDSGAHPNWVFRAVSKTANSFQIAAYDAGAAFAQVDLSAHPNEVTLGVAVFAVQA